MRLRYSFAIAPTLLVFIALVTTCPPSLVAQQLSRTERHEIRDRHWGRGLDPKHYLDLLEQIRRMPGEREGKSESSLLRATRWENIGPIAIRNIPGNNFHGRMKSVRFYRNPTTGTTETYLGSSSGGLWLGNFAGLVRIWTSLGDNLPNPAVGAFLIDSLDPNTIWVGSGDKHRYAGAGLFKSTNRGGSWTRVALTSLDLKPSAITGLEYGKTRNIMYLSSDIGFFNSSDGGASWTRRAPSFAGALVERMRVDPLQRDTLYVACPWGVGFFRSFDGGRSFTPINNGIRPINPMSVVIAVSPSSPNILYAAMSNDVGGPGKLYKSTNRGDRWDSLPDPPAYLGQAFNNHAIAVSPTDPNTVYVGGVGLMRTTDGGQTWAMRDAGHSDVTEIVYPPLSGGQVIVLSDGGFYIHSEASDLSSNAAEGFQPGAPLQAYSLEDAWSNSKVMASGLQDNGTAVTDNAGARNEIWWLAGGCDGGNMIAIHPTNPSQMYFNSWCGPNYRIRSDDMGRSQVHLNGTLGDNFFYVPLRMNKGGTNYPFTLTHQHMYFSKDSGITWSRATAGPGLDFDTGAAASPPYRMNLSLHADGPPVAYVQFEYKNGRERYVRTFTGEGGVMVMADRLVDPANPNGLHYVQVDRWRSRYAYAFSDRTDPARIAELGTAKIYRTTDGGVTWTSITGNLPNVNTNDIVSSPTDENHLWAATELGVFNTTNGGTTWRTYQNGLPMVSVTAMNYIRGTGFDTLRIATFGRGYWSRVLDGNDPMITINASIGNALLRDISVVGRATEPIDLDTLVVVGTNGLIGHSSDGGRSLRFERFPTAGTFNSIASSDRSNVTIVGDSGLIIHSANAAREWQQVASGVTVALRRISFNGATGILIGDDGVIMRSTNSGAAWTRVHDEKNAILIGLSQPTAGDAWVTGGRSNPNGGTTPVQFRSTDGGATWVEWQTPPALFSSLTMIDVTNGFASGIDGAVYATTDGGSTWMPKPTGVQVPLTDLEVVSPQLLYATTFDGRIISSSDGGAKWAAEELDKQPGTLYALTQGSQEIIAVGDSAIVFIRRTAKDADTSLLPEYITTFPNHPEYNALRPAGIDDDAATRALRIESIVPNPSSGATTIRFALARPSRVAIAIHTMLGESIATLDASQLAQGSHSATWDGNDAAGRPVPAGTYLIRVTTRSKTVVDRVVIVR